MINVWRDAATLHLKKGGNNMRDNPAPIILSNSPAMEFLTRIQTNSSKLLRDSNYMTREEIIKILEELIEDTQDLKMFLPHL